MRISAQQYQFWKPYIELLDCPSQFAIDQTGYMPIVHSPFYVGFDASQAEGGDAFLSTMVLPRVKEFRSMMARSDLAKDEIMSALMIVPHQYYDEFLLMLLDKYAHCLSDAEHWDLITTIWVQQELNSDSGRVPNWLSIFTMRAPIASLTAELPDKFTVYRAGDPSGLSWSRKKRVAQWFANRLHYCGVVVPISKRLVTRSEVLFFTNARNEHEVVII